MRQSRYYHANSNTYYLDGIGSTATLVVTDVKTQENRTTLTLSGYILSSFEYYYWEDTLVVEAAGDSWRYVSLDHGETGYIAKEDAFA